MRRLPLMHSSLALLLVALPGLRADEASQAQTAPAQPKQSSEKGKKKEADKSKSFPLGEVTVVITGKMEVLEQANTRVETEQIQELHRDTVASALDMLPGVSLNLNTRNEMSFYVRGNDARRMPVFVDGIPVYVPYDGNADFSRFTTFDLAEIQVAKGFSSVLYGPNTLGGAINLVTRKPTQRFEGDALAGVSDGQGKKAAVNLGSNLGFLYLQGGLSYTSADDFRMSSNFVPNVREDGGRRDNSDFKDWKGSLKIGFTPNATDEYTIGYVNQQGEKGNPVGTDLSQPARYWRWPTWDKASVYATTNTAIGDKSYLRFRAYHDTYKNTIFAYTDATYTKLATTGGMAPVGKSFYDDFTHGVMAEFGTMAIPHNSLRFVVQEKMDVHRETNGDPVIWKQGTIAWKQYKDDYLSMGAEDSITFNERWDLSLGLGLDRLKPENSGAWSLPPAKSCSHFQAGLFWKVMPTLQLYASIAQKEHFPTLKDRYSLKFSTFIENPYLLPERSTNYEIGLKADPLSWMHYEVAIFRSDIKNLIQERKNVSGAKSQMQNIGEVRHTGAEASLTFTGRLLQGNVSYTYLNRENLSNPTIMLTSTPKNRFTGYLKCQPFERFYFLASVQCQDSQWDSDTVRLGGFTTTDLSATWIVTPKLNVDAGFKNALDRNYQLSSGFPLPGRTWFVNAHYRF